MMGSVGSSKPASRLRIPAVGFLVAISFAASQPPAAAAGERRSRTTTTSSFVMTRAADPPRTVVTDTSGAWIATFTDGTRTVTLAGPSRRFAEGNTAATVTTSTWVRVLPAPFSGIVDTSWLTSARTDTSADLFGLAVQYLSGAPAIITAGRQIAGDASFGPLQPDGTRQEGSDFNDYLGLAWTYPTTVDQPEANQFRSLDCSGFMRMIWGYRTGLPVSLSPDGTSIPRRAVDMAAQVPGIMAIADSGSRTTAYSRLLPGDLVFFDASTNDGTAIDHVGMYLGVDSTGHHRFVSSRKSADGPTLGDTSGKSILDGTGLYGVSFRSARRL